MLDRGNRKQRGHVFERGNHVIAEIWVRELTTVVDHLLKQRLPNPEHRAALNLQLAEEWVHDASRKAGGVKAEDLDLAGFRVDLYLARRRGMVPVDRADSLTGLGIEPA